MLSQVHSADSLGRKYAYVGEDKIDVVAKVKVILDIEIRETREGRCLNSFSSARFR